MPDIAIARPFTFVDANAKRWEVGIAVYTGMSQEFCDAWYIQAHSEQAVLAAGRLLYQTRDILGLDPATGTYHPFLGARHAIFLDPTRNSEYTQTIEPGWPPLFINDCDAIHLDNPPAELPPASPPWLRGWKVDHDWAPRHDGPVVTNATRLYPGDLSPPIAPAVDGGNLGRAANQDAAHLIMQREQQRATNAIAARYIDSPPDPKPIPLPQRPDPRIYTYVDPRGPTVPVAASPEQPAPDDGRTLLPHYSYEQGIRQRLQRADHVSAGGTIP